jgi:hypothetical protein
VLVAISVERPLISVPTFSPIFPSISVAGIIKLGFRQVRLQRKSHHHILL